MGGLVRGGEGGGEGGDLTGCPGCPAAAYRSPVGWRRGGTGVSGCRYAVGTGALLNCWGGCLRLLFGYQGEKLAGWGEARMGEGRGGIVCFCCAAVEFCCAGSAGGPACPGLICWFVPPILQCLRKWPVTMPLVYLFGLAPSTSEGLFVPSKLLVVWLW